METFKNNSVINEISCNIHNSIDGYTLIILEDNDISCCVVVDDECKEVVPFTVFDGKILPIVIFKNGKAIYAVEKEQEEKFYLIDLKNVRFILEDGKGIPINPLMTFDGYDDINDDFVSVLINGKYIVLKVSEATLSKLSFDYMGYTDQEQMIGILNVPTGMYYPYLEVLCFFDNDGKINNNIYIEGVKSWICDELLLDTEALGSYISNTYFSLFKEDAKCKKLIH